MKKSESHFQGAAIAHRGLFTKLSPENSIEAIENAILQGYGVEFDVRLSLDKKVMVFHDDNLQRLCGMNLNIAAQPSKSLQELKLSHSNCHIPTLETVLQMLEKQSPKGLNQLIVIELKSFDHVLGFTQDYQLEKATVVTLRNFKNLPFPVVLKSFNPYTVEFLLNQNLPWRVGLLSCDYQKDEDFTWIKDRTALQNLDHPVAKACHFISYNINDLTSSLSTQVRLRGQSILTWTVRTAEQHKKAQTLADNYIFEGPFG